MRYSSFEEHLGCCMESRFMRLKAKSVLVGEMSVKSLQAEVLVT